MFQNFFCPYSHSLFVKYRTINTVNIVLCNLIYFHISFLKYIFIYIYIKSLKGAYIMYLAYSSETLRPTLLRVHINLDVQERLIFPYLKRKAVQSCLLSIFLYTLHVKIGTHFVNKRCLGYSNSKPTFMPLYRRDSLPG